MEQDGATSAESPVRMTGLFAGLTVAVEEETPKLSNNSKRAMQSPPGDTSNLQAPSLLRPNEEDLVEQLPAPQIEDESSGALEDTISVPPHAEDEQQTSVETEEETPAENIPPTEESKEERAEETQVDSPLSDTRVDEKPADSSDESPLDEAFSDSQPNSNTVDAPVTSYSSYFSGWFGSAAPAPAAEPTDTVTEEAAAETDVTGVNELQDSNDDEAIQESFVGDGVQELNKDEAELSADEATITAAESPSDPPVTIQVPSAEQLSETEQSTESQENAMQRSLAAQGPEDAEANSGDPVETADTPSQGKEMNEEDKQHLEDAFDHSESNETPSSVPLPTHERRTSSGPGQIKDETPIPDPDGTLRLLRKFAHKTRQNVISTYGGKKGRPIMSYIFRAKEDPVFVPYRELMDILFEEGEEEEIPDESDRVVNAVMGGAGDTADRARRALTAFVNLFSMWGHASSRNFEKKDRKGQLEFSLLLSGVFDAASELVAHGCLDGVSVALGRVGEQENKVVIDMLTQSIFNADLSLDRNELAAMKFLLVSGCRTVDNGEALLHGGYLLQSIRTLYHVYLTTESMSNRTTARAALQQLTTSVFNRVVLTDTDKMEPTKDHFPSQNHRDVFLVLRSLCKLSMRSLPDVDSAGSFVGLQSSGSADTWDERQDATQGIRGTQANGGGESVHEHAHLLFTSAIHPALESKLLALELILYVLQHMNVTKEFIEKSGPQFHAAIKNYLCVSLLKNCTSDNTEVVNLSLRIFVPLVRNFRSILKNEIEAFVTNVFFVILDSKNSPAEHKSLVVKTFEEICSDPKTLAEIFLNYDCDLSAVDLFHRIVNTLSTVSRSGLQEQSRGSTLFMGSQGVARVARQRSENRVLRLTAMKALRQVLASLHGCIIEPLSANVKQKDENTSTQKGGSTAVQELLDGDEKQNLVEIYGSKVKRREEETEIILRFNQKPSAGIAYAVKCGHLDGDDPKEVAKYLLQLKDAFDKTQIGEYLGREVEYQNGFSIKVLHEYVRLLNFEGLPFDDAIRYFLSSFRLPGEAQKIDRIMEKFAERFTEQNAGVFPSADAAFILSFSIIMLNTDLHNPAIKEERRMTKEGFIRNNRGICDGKDLPEDLLSSIFDRIKRNPISLKEDDEARERAAVVSLPNTVSFFSAQEDSDRAKESNFQKERDHILRTTESLLKRRRPSDVGHKSVKSKTDKPSRHHTQRFVMAEDSGLRDEYVSPMFDVTWGPALAAFSTAMESANGTGSLINIASDDELEVAAENAAETIEVCLTGFRFAITTAGLCGNSTARDAYMGALAGFTQLGSGRLLEPRHLRCIQTMLSLAKESGELLGTSWEHVFKALSEINRFHQLFHMMARNDRVASAAAERRRAKLEAKNAKRKEQERRRAAAEDGESINGPDTDASYSTDEDSLAESTFFDDDDFQLEEEMDSKAIDEANARAVYDAVSETIIEAIYERSSSLSPVAVKEFVLHLCRVSKSEISVGVSTEGAVGTKTDLTAVAYRDHHVLLANSQKGLGKDPFHHSQPNIYNLQKLVEVTHYNMDSRPRLLFAELWNIVADHLTETALHPNPALAMYAVDSFRQMSIQYLQREELEVFEFQKRFLKPLETVMGRSKQTSTKELLLNCVARIIHVFGENLNESSAHRGGLRSGWVPLLAILGLGGQDVEKSIAEMSSEILNQAIEPCLNRTSEHAGVLDDHFVECATAYLRLVDGPNNDLSLMAIDKLLILAKFLANKTEIPRGRRRPSEVPLETDISTKELELWWPILLGLSKSVGDERLSIRTKTIEALEHIINRYFFPGDKNSLCNGKSSDDNMQTLQLIFRGILTPVLEFAETGIDNEESQRPALPEDIDLFLVPKVTKKGADEAVEEVPFSGTDWLDTTFDVVLNLCISICLRSINAFDDTSLVDEVLAILNNCLISDSGPVAVRGLYRLEEFLVKDLNTALRNEDVWATACHMLRRCLTVRGLPEKPTVVTNNTQETQSDDESSMAKDAEMAEREYLSSVEEFVAEEKLLTSRRYIGSNAIFIVGRLLTNDSLAISMKWSLFLIAGLGAGIQDWEEAASLLTKGMKKREEPLPRAPDHIETAVYARKWLNRFILQIAAMSESTDPHTPDDGKPVRTTAGQKLVTEETRKLIAKYLEVERVALEYGHTHADELVYAKFTDLLKELLNGFFSFDAFHLNSMQWITPILLGGIGCKKEEILSLTQKLVTRVSSTPEPEKAPKEDGSADNESDDLTTESQPKEKLKNPAADSTQIEEGNGSDAVGHLELIETVEKLPSNVELDETPKQPEALVDNSITKAEEGLTIEPPNNAVDPPADRGELYEASGLHNSSRTDSMGSLIKEAEV
ncbi:hypothetical protein FisN_42Hh007 [Fistulifera solaris]|uniref:SEC7 domain-containing protein n=1 Tax=Fistulifera solaris TaxID=1519565 RepID=A0A1Z5KIK8_FISSO|nr:hypothetical protein FisN_42Hh007 [Fistulifera solaris]|eukprot:GAX26099.1 hypothetical protein FisN_42Hh007 [Fistulifera solaris]